MTNIKTVMSIITRTFQLSCNTFGGFTCDIDVNQFDTIQAIINNVVSDLRKVLQQNNMHVLENNLDTIHSDYHIHDYEYGHILITDQIFYICNHEHPDL